MSSTTGLTHECCGERFDLHHERVIHWKARRTLLAADVHFGKEEVFGRHGIAIPHGPSSQSLERLGTMLAATGAERLCVLGDFMHAAPKPDERWLFALSQFLDRHTALSVDVVAGNHDKRAGRLLVDARIRWIDDASPEPPFVLRHVPGSDTRGYVLSGHLHPVFRLQAGGRKRRSVRAPAFWFREDHAVLPSFGEFTGGHIITPEAGDQVFLAGPDSVIAVPTSKSEGSIRCRCRQCLKENPNSP